MMKKIILPILTIGILTTTSCVKDDSNCKDVLTSAPASEVTTLDNYISSKGIIATKDTRGFYFKINTAGSDAKPTVCNTVNVKYKGALTNGVVFDQNTVGTSFPLSNLILGWQEGIPLIGSGGSITLYLPPSMGYGAAGTSGIPGNSILIFDIDLISF